MATHMRSVAEVVEALGGDATVAKRFGVSQQAVRNWREKQFPANTYLAITRILFDLGHTADAALWPMVDLSKPRPRRTRRTRISESACA